MTEEEFRKLVQIKLAEANLSQYANKITDIISEVYMKGLTDGFNIGQKNRVTMKRRTEKKFSTQLLADYAEDHAMIKNAIGVMICGDDMTFMCCFHDKELEGLASELARKIIKLKK